MASIINASTSGAGGLISTADNSGTLQLQTAGTTAMTINSSQVVNFANSPTIAGSAFPSGAMSLISTKTASSSTSISWTGLSGFNNYRLMISNLAPAGSDFFVLVFGTGSSPTYLTSNYVWASTSTANSTGNTSINQQLTTASTASNIRLMNAGFYPSTTSGMSGTIDITGMILNYPTISGVVGNVNQSYGNNYGQVQMISGLYIGGSSTSTPITAINISTASSTVFSGSASLYGISS